LKSEVFANLSQKVIILPMQTDTLKVILRQQDFSLTRPRKLIFDFLLNSEPLTIQQVTKGVRDEVDRATVYRTVELFEKTGIVQRVNFGWKYKIELSDIFKAHHHHMQCTKCGKIITLPANSMLETMIDTVAAKANFSPRGHSLEIYGLCPSCQSN
jgi:Fur family ferric uptake transcriptional regulator